ncbi:site-specific integrase [Candidatus Enterococcus clewellii]|uniref:Tyr recombinase domain-containing protein n=1 Tax=Candidatus Enterococcus clewellii TaxID=1834193 RepID=A0AAQ3VXB2_9ENTE
MAKKGENIYKRKDGRYEGRYIKNRSENGKIIFGYVYDRKYSVVKKKLNLLKSQHNHLDRIHRTFQGNLADWLHYWLEYTVKRSVKPSTHTVYLGRVKKHIIPFLGNKKMTKLDTRDINEFVQHLQFQRLAATTIRGIITVLKYALSQACKENYLMINPCENVTLPKATTTSIDALSIEQQKILEEYALQDTECSPVILSLYTGMRIGEISGLKWSDIDFENNVIHVRRTLLRISCEGEKARTTLILGSPKTDSSKRSIPLAENLKDYLLENKKNATSTFVISCKNSFAEPRVINYRFKKITEKSGLSIHFHALRHTFATRCVEKGVDIASLSKLLGHASIKMTLDTYTDSLWENRQTAISVIDADLNIGSL